MPSPSLNDLRRAFYGASSGESLSDAEYEWLARFSTSKTISSLSQWGAKDDDTTDSTASIQAALNRFSGSSAGIKGGTISVDGKYRITDTLIIKDSAIRMAGLHGRGDVQGFSSWLRWDGPAGIPMIRVESSNGVELEHFAMLGNDASPPSSCVEFAAAVPNHVGLQQGCSVHHMVMGRMVAGGAIQNGVVIQGLADNDLWSVEHVEMTGVRNAGIDVINPQATWNQVSHLFVSGDIGTPANYGIRTTADLNARNIYFDQINKCLAVTSEYARITVLGVYAEQCARLWDTVGASIVKLIGGSFSLYGGTSPGSVIGRSMNIGSGSVEITVNVVANGPLPSPVNKVEFGNDGTDLNYRAGRVNFDMPGSEFVLAFTNVSDPAAAQVIVASGESGRQRWRNILLGNTQPRLDVNELEVIKVGIYATVSRPSAAGVPGSMIYDLTLGKPIWSNGSAWIDATGSLV